MSEASFGTFILDYDRGTLLESGRPIVVGQRALALLNALVLANGQVLPKSKLMEAGWPGTIVEEGNLAVQIATLRKVLGRREDGQEWILTVPRVGYRLIQSRQAEASPITRPQLPTVAVVPFRNLGSDPEQDYFVEGIIDDVIIALSRFRALAVMARSATLAYKGRVVDARDVARTLGVRYVLEGSVRRSGDRLRINAQLVDGETDVQLWAESYDSQLQSVFELQDRITESVVSIVAPTVERAEMERARRKAPTSLTAYELYLQAYEMAFGAANPEILARGRDLIEQSLAIDPDFVPALAVAATSYIGLFTRQLPGATEAKRLRGLEHAHKAMELAGNDALARVAAANTMIKLGYEFETGMANARRAVAENPNSADVLIIAGLCGIHAGELGETEGYLRRALALNANTPNSPWLLTAIAHVKMAEGKFEEALDLALQAHGVSPENHPNHWMLIAANAYLGHLDEARRWRARLQQLLPDTTLTRIRQGQPMKDPHRIDVLIEGMRLAGMPES